MSTVPHNLSNDLASSSLQTVLDKVRQTVAPTWPLQDYVAVNPYQGLSDKRFLEARDTLRAISDCEMLMPLDFYRQQYVRGRLKLSDIGTALNEIIEEGVPGAHVLTELQLIDWIRGPQISGPDPLASRSCWSFSRELDLLSATRWTDVIAEELSKVCSAHYDLGQAVWSSPWKDKPLFTAWKRRAEIDRRMELKGLRAFHVFVGTLPYQPAEVIGTLLTRLDVPESRWESYLMTLAYETPGWSAFTRYQADQAIKRGEPGDDFLGLLAMRLAYDCAVAESFEVTVDWMDRLHSPEPLQPESDPAAIDPNSGLVRYALMRADEISYRRNFLAGLETEKATLQDADHDVLCQHDPRPPRRLAQLVFCIDVRSERIRRNLEATSHQLETFGFAGFFGLPMEYLPLGESQGSNQLPVLVDPVMKVREAIRQPRATTASVDLEFIDRKRDVRTLAKLWQRFQKSAASCFSFVESIGVVYAVGLVRGMLGKPARKHDGLPRRSHTRNAVDESCVVVGPTLDGLAEQGFTMEHLADLAQGILTNLGLTANFARLVAFCGHASQTENNPMQSGLDCGACAGHSGESNARFAALLLNHPEIRDILRDRGLEVPGDVHFLGGLHNTTTDEVLFFDTDLVPESHHTNLQAVRQLVGDAGERTRSERAPTLLATDAATLPDRSRDWSEVRPEWGLTGNAAFFIGPRWMTSNNNLHGRSFMHSYDESLDPEGEVLEQIMTAPMIVTNWINMQYFASTVDQKHFGCGNKTIHNVVGKFGLLEGNGGDLRSGLAWQSLHDGEKYQHDPIRLLVVIAARRSSIDRIIGAHDNVRALAANGWVQLVCVEDAECYRYSPLGVWKSLADPCPITNP